MDSNNVGSLRKQTISTYLVSIGPAVWLSVEAASWNRTGVGLIMLVPSLLAKLAARLANITILFLSKKERERISKRIKWAADPNKKEDNQHKHSDLLFFIYHSFIYHSFVLAVRGLRTICRYLRWFRWWRLLRIFTSRLLPVSFRDVWNHVCG